MTPFCCQCSKKWCPPFDVFNGPHFFIHEKSLIHGKTCLMFWQQWCPTTACVSIRDMRTEKRGNVCRGHCWLVWIVDNFVTQTTKPGRSWFHDVPCYQRYQGLDSGFIQYSFQIQDESEFYVLFVKSSPISLRVAVSGRHDALQLCWQDTSSSPSCPQMQAAGGFTSCTWSEK